MRTTTRALRLSMLVVLAGLTSACAIQPAAPAAPPSPEDDPVASAAPTAPTSEPPEPTPDASGGTYGTAVDPAQLPSAPPLGALEAAASEGVTYLLSAAGDRDAIAHPARFWVDDHSCLRVDVDDADGYFAVLDQTVVVTADGVVGSDGTKHTFESGTTVGGQAVPQMEIPDAFRTQCGEVSADRLWGAGL